MNEQYIKQQIKKLSYNGRWYQEIDFNGIQTPLKNKKQRFSPCYNKGKWDNFIKPLILFKDVSKKTFVEMGCNAGLYLLLAKQMGFKRIIGIEPNDNCFKQAQFVLDYHKEIDTTYDSVELIHRRVGTCTYDKINDNNCDIFSFNDIPVADITLLASVLYWMPTKEAATYVKELSKHSRYAIVICRLEDGGRTVSKGGLSSTLKYFKKDWTKINQISVTDVPIKKGEAKRDIIALLFKSYYFDKRNSKKRISKTSSNISTDTIAEKKISLKDIYVQRTLFRHAKIFEDITLKDLSIKKSPHYKFLKAYINNGEDRESFEEILKKTEYYKMQNAFRGYNKSIRKSNAFIKLYHKMKNKINNKLITLTDNSVFDIDLKGGYEVFNGHHRLAIHAILGHKKVLCRIYHVHDGNNNKIFFTDRYYYVLNK